MSNSKFPHENPWRISRIYIRNPLYPKRDSERIPGIWESTSVCRKNAKLIHYGDRLINCFLGGNRISSEPIFKIEEFFFCILNFK